MFSENIKMTQKIKISMVQYKDGKPVDVAYGEYKPQDVEIFKDSGFVDTEEGLAKQIEAELMRQDKEKAK